MAWLDGHTHEEKSRFSAPAMVTTPVNPTIEAEDLEGSRLPLWPARSGSQFKPFASPSHAEGRTSMEAGRRGATGRDALQALLAFSALHQQVRQRRALAIKHRGFEVAGTSTEFERREQFVLDDVLQLVAERAIAVTGADGLAIALAENNEIVLRASAGTIKPDVGARIRRDSAFSGASFRTAQIIRCDDSEADDRVNIDACRQLGARSMGAVPLCGRKRVIGLLQAFSAEPFGFNDSDVSSLELLAELILGALKPEDEDRFAESAEVAEAGLKAAAVPKPLAVAPAAQPSVQPAVQKETVKEVGEVAVPAVAEVVSTSPAKKTVEVPAVAAAMGEVLLPAETKIEAVAVPAALITETSIPENVPAEAASEGDSEPRSRTALVLMLVVLAVLAGAGLWWKLSNSQLSALLIKPEEKMSTKPQSVVSSPSVASPAAVPANPASTAQTGQDAASGLNAANDSADGSAQDSSAKNGSKLARVTGIRHWSSGDSSTVVLDLEDQVQYEAHRLANPDRIYFDLHDTSLATELVAKTIEVGDPLLARVRVAQPTPGLTRVVLETKGNADYSVSLEPSPYRLVVQVHKIGANTKSDVNLFPGQAEREKMAGFVSPIVVPPPTHEDLLLRSQVRKMKIVVDAGHGGWDLGTVGKHGLLEKDVVLEIAQRLGKLLETRLGSDVILTRNDDNYIPLDERAGMANQSQADLFVSVHANYSDLPSARGVETYYTNSFSSPSAKDLETRSANVKKVALTSLSPADLHDRIEQSRRLAASVERSLYGTLSVQNPGLRDRGVKEASYVVLTETAMPGILAEVSFVSSPTDEQKLRSDGYREQIAEALYKGIARYAATAHGVKMASR